MESFWVNRWTGGSHGGIKKLWGKSVSMGESGGVIKIQIKT